MFIKVTQSDFAREFYACGRGENFSNEGLDLLFNYLEELENDTGEEQELDVIALCCEWSEDDAQDINDNYSLDIDRDRYLNTYRCDDCGEEWENEWSCACDDECPECGTPYSPVSTEENFDDDEFLDRVRDAVEQHTQVAGVTDAGTIVYLEW